MGRFFVQASQIVDDTVTLTGSDAGHIARVLRMTVGESITVCDMQGKEYQCTLAAVTPEQVQARVVEICQNQTESAYRTVLYQALPKGDKMETLIQKAVECGVCEIVPVASERCVVRLDEKTAQKKVERWQKIAQSAAEQSGRGIVPRVRMPISFAKAIEEAKALACAFVCYEGEQSRMLGAILPDAPTEIGFFIGPEGGFSQGEVTRVLEAGLPCVGLGRRILRTETASTFVLSALVYRYELQDFC